MIYSETNKNSIINEYTENNECTEINEAAGINEAKNMSADTHMPDCMSDTECEDNELDEFEEEGEYEEFGESENYVNNGGTLLLNSDISGARIDSWIAKNVEGISRSYVRKLFDEEKIKVNGSPVKQNYKLKDGDRVEIALPEPKRLDITPEDIKLDILYEDNDIIVVNKPKGMVVHPAAGNYSGTLVNALMYHCGDSLSDINGVIRPGIVHRIDKDTSGVLVVAKSNRAHEVLTQMLKKHEMNRIYIAVAEGIFREESGKVDAPIGRHQVDRKKMAVNTKSGRNAVTHFKVLERFADSTLLELKLETGRTHQIRVHMSFIGHPLLDDEVYGRRRQKYDINGQALHARLLGFKHPITNEYMEFEADLPEYFRKLLDHLRKNKV